MDLNFKCPLCPTYFDTQEELSEHVQANHASYYDTYLIPPVLIFPGESTAVVASEAPATVITTEPVSTADVLIEPAPVPDDGCCECDCCDCCGGDIGADAGGGDGGCGDCDCDCDCVIM
ncbi:AAEL010909-PA [Aedes aegypti]|uniref:AAEL010909-PA n=1 Tax=Aedes aegypti TaxID=7159 RepID=Q16RL9_AEDAE|nr:AAEL010909-PA [Aedes aegypti]